MTLNDLLERDGWIMFTYGDGSKHCFRTTLNSDMLKSVGGKRDDELYDLDKYRWVAIPSDTSISMSLSETKPELSEVDEFANRFI